MSWVSTRKSQTLGAAQSWGLIAARVLLAGHLLQAKGDRVAMHFFGPGSLPISRRGGFSTSQQSSIRAGNSADSMTSTARLLAER
jgi:hypothetical protein